MSSVEKFFQRDSLAIIFAITAIALLCTVAGMQMSSTLTAQTTGGSLPCPADAQRSYKQAVDGDQAAYMIDYALYVCRSGQTHAEMIEASNANMPSISGNWVAYFKNYGISAYNLASGKSVEIEAQLSGSNYPAISGNWIVYYKNYGISAYNVESGKRIEIEPANFKANHPVISGKWVAYPKGYGVSLYNLDTGEKTELEKADTGCNDVKIVGNTVKYSCNRGTITRTLEQYEASSSVTGQSTGGSVFASTDCIVQSASDLQELKVICDAAGLQVAVVSQGQGSKVCQYSRCVLPTEKLTCPTEQVRAAFWEKCLNQHAMVQQQTATAGSACSVQYIQCVNALPLCSTNEDTKKQTASCAALHGSVSFSFNPVNGCEYIGCDGGQKSTGMKTMTVQSASSSSPNTRARYQTIQANRVLQVNEKQRLNPRLLRMPTATNVLHNAAQSSRAPVVLQRAGCGDGLVILPEQCDDGNTVNGDGCSGTCTIETGYQCNSAQPSVCWDACGDGLVSTREECDDGNGIGGDGCNPYCKREPGYTCTGSPSVCTVIPECGNRIIETGETCDDGNTRDGDGCSATCQIETP